MKAFNYFAVSVSIILAVLTLVGVSHPPMALVGATAFLAYALVLLRYE